MKKLNKKVFAAFLVVAMIVTMLPMTVFAAWEEPAGGSVTTVTDLVYDGTAQKLLTYSTTGPQNHHRYYVSTTAGSYTPTASEWVYVVPSKTDAGKYYVQAEYTTQNPADPSGVTYWNDACNGFTRNTGSLVEIKKATLTSATSGTTPGTYIAPTAKTGLHYNGEEQELINKGVLNLYSDDDAKAKNVRFKYCVTDTDITTAPLKGKFTEKTPKGTLAKTYRVWYMIIAAPEYSDSNYNTIYPNDTNYIDVTINQATLIKGEGTDSGTYVAPTAKTNLKYNGEEQVLINKGILNLYGEDAKDKNVRFKYCVTDTDITTAPKKGKFTEKIPKGTLAKTYRVWYMIIAYPEYNESQYNTIYPNDTNYIDVTIETKALEATDFIYTAPKDLIYTGKAIAPKVEILPIYGVKGEPVVFYKDANGKSLKEAVDPGKYEVWAKLPQGESANKFSDNPADVKVGEFEIKEAPKTGDANNMILWVVVALAAVALAGTSILVFSRKKVNK